jgi:hypothetical protein
MSKSQDPIENIVQHLQSKSVVKQRTYKHLVAAFRQIKKQASVLVKQINQRIGHVDKGVTVKMKEVSSSEFHVKVAGDLLVFLLHTNIVTYDKEHAIVNSSQIEEDVNRKYFGQMMVYNFMSDSIKYNRLNDPGYLVARVLINYENHFFVEGEGQLNFLFKNISDKPITPMDLDVIIKLAITKVAQSDLITPPYKDIKYISLKQKKEKDHHMGAGEKIGFKMSYQDENPSY